MKNCVYYIIVHYKEEKPEGTYIGDKFIPFRSPIQATEEFESLRSKYKNDEEFKDEGQGFSSAYYVRTGPDTGYKVSFRVWTGHTPSGQEHHFGPYLKKG